jgi:hypothetical protein
LFLDLFTGIAFQRTNIFLGAIFERKMRQGKLTLKSAVVTISTTRFNIK